MGKMTTTTKLSLTALALALLFATGVTAGGLRTAIVATNDWPLNSALSLGEFNCPGGELVVDPLTGFEVCSPGSRTHIRDVMYYTCTQAFTADGAAEARFTGVLLYTLSANWDAEYTGAIWGSWLLVPAESCDPSVLDDPGVYWVGSLQAQRTAVCGEGGPCAWIGNLRFVGRGHGDSLAGLHFKGTELIVTYTPFPMPYEMLAAFGLCQPGSCPTGPEGHFTGTIR